MSRMIVIVTSTAQFRLKPLKSTTKRFLETHFNILQKMLSALRISDIVQVQSHILEPKI